MINKQASALPRRLIRKFKCNAPFELAEALDIDVMERADFKRQKAKRSIRSLNTLTHALPGGLAAGMWSGQPNGKEWHSMAKRTYLAIDLKSYYASAECAARHLDPLTTNLVVQTL